MTQTAEPQSTAPTTAPAPSAEAAEQRVATWLADFEDALRARDIERATSMFAATCYWRDLIAFSWNRTTVEHHDGVADL